MATRRRRSIFDIIEEYFENMEEWLERLRESLVESPSWDCKTCTMEPLSDVTVTNDEVIVTVDLPYAEENTIRVTPTSKDTIEVSAKMKRKVSFNDFGITHHRGEFHTFRCQVHIPVPVYLDKMEIRLKKGILEIRIPRKREYEISIE
ncbi:Hsp20/alpha crystallin family protein [Candidatus Bathyarchaeota archaeon]|nr:Hsp20/alpha crystallin family protein [Candidatus Bathyarchaeota archaeon]